MSSRLTIERALAAADPNAISTVTPRCALVLGPVIVRRSRGFAPAVVATLPVTAPVLAVGGGLKKAVVLVVEGQACASQHVGDLSHADARRAFEQTVHDLLAVTRSITFDGQASTWLEELARSAGSDSGEFTWGFTGAEIDWRELLVLVVEARQRGQRIEAIARAFHPGFARAIAAAAIALADNASVDTVVLSGGVMQNQVRVADIRDALDGSGRRRRTDAPLRASRDGGKPSHGSSAKVGLPTVARSRVHTRSEGWTRI